MLIPSKYLPCPPHDTNATSTATSSPPSYNAKDASPTKAYSPPHNVKETANHIIIPSFSSPTTVTCDSIFDIFDSDNETPAYPIMQNSPPSSIINTLWVPTVTINNYNIGHPPPKKDEEYEMFDNNDPYQSNNNNIPSDDHPSPVDKKNDIYNPHDRVQQKAKYNDDNTTFGPQVYNDHTLINSYDQFPKDSTLEEDDPPSSFKKSTYKDNDPPSPLFILQ